MAEEELNTENEEDLWAAAADDLAQQKDMLHKAAAEPQGESSPAPSVEAPAGSDVAETAQQEASPPPQETVATATAVSAPPVSEELDRIMDLPLKVSVQLGRSKMLINDLLQLGQGSVIELTKLVGEPLEVLINGKLVAKGEVVVVNEKFGVRLTEISSAKDRIESMG